MTRATQCGKCGAYIVYITSHEPTRLQEFFRGMKPEGRVLTIDAETWDQWDATYQPGKHKIHDCSRWTRLERFSVVFGLAVLLWVYASVVMPRAEIETPFFRTGFEPVCERGAFRPTGTGFVETYCDRWRGEG